MKGITICADCAYYRMKTHKCNRGCTGEPNIENGDNVRFFTDCPLPNVAEVRHGRWIFVGEETLHDGWTYRKHKCSECGFSTVEATNFCPNCGAKMDAPAVNRWIPCSERLPEPLQNVIVCTDIRTVTLAWLNGDHWVFANTGNGHTENWGFNAVTHWMPLPSTEVNEYVLDK